MHACRATLSQPATNKSASYTDRRRLAATDDLLPIYEEPLWAVFKDDVDDDDEMTLLPIYEELLLANFGA